MNYFNCQFAPISNAPLYVNMLRKLTLTKPRRFHGNASKVVKNKHVFQLLSAQNRLKETISTAIKFVPTRNAPLFVSALVNLANKTGD